MSKINFCKLYVGEELRFDVGLAEQFLGSIRLNRLTQNWEYYPSHCDGGQPMLVKKDLTALKAEICASELDGTLIAPDRSGLKSQTEASGLAHALRSFVNQLGDEKSGVWAVNHGCPSQTEARS